MNKNILSNTPKSPIKKVERLMEIQKIMKELKPELDQLKEELLITMQDLDVLSLKTGEYTLSRAKRVTPKITDQEALKVSLKENNIPFEMVEAFAPFMSEVFKQAIEEKRELDGLEALETEYVSVRIK